MPTVTVSDKGQVVIPAAIRRRLGLGPGSKLDFELEGDSIRARPLKSIPPSRAEEGYGMLRSSGRAPPGGFRRGRGDAGRGR